ncbi:MAG: NAD(P)H-hydrate dehydratase [Clostridiales Family XIII bacterium]|jgi:NAD(P)H-hydrate epimerase|nr:NAD(P)H-hydrate dehydratase [Clostridiales Family XIII bacterium]
MGINLETITANDVRLLLKRRPKDSHKGSAGRVLVIAGSPGMAGAAVLSAKAALKSGTGLVSVSIEEGLWSIVQVAEPCAICVGRGFARSGLQNGAEVGWLPQGGDCVLDGYDAIAIGPGLGTGDAEQALVDCVLRRYRGRLVLDADALNILARRDMRPAESDAEVIITPHPGEAGRLLACGSGAVNADRADAVRRLADYCGGTAVLKGHESLVCAGGVQAGGVQAGAPGTVWLNPTGNPGMATAGSGDVLTGVVAAFAGMGLSASDAARAGVYVHGLAGDRAAERLGEYGLTAMDIAGELPFAIRQVQAGG